MRSRLLERFFYEVGRPLSCRLELLWIQVRSLVTFDFSLAGF